MEQTTNGARKRFRSFSVDNLSLASPTEVPAAADPHTASVYEESGGAATDRRSAGRPRIYTPDEADERLRAKQAHRRFLVRLETQTLLQYIPVEFYQSRSDPAEEPRVAMSQLRQLQLVLAYTEDLVQRGVIEDVPYEESAVSQLTGAVADGEPQTDVSGQGEEADTAGNYALSEWDFTEGGNFDKAAYSAETERSGPGPVERAGDADALAKKSAEHAERERKHRDDVRRASLLMLRYIPLWFMREWLAPVHRRGYSSIDSRTPLITYAERPRLVRAYFEHLYHTGTLARLDFDQSAASLHPNPETRETVLATSHVPPLPNDSRITVAQQQRAMMGIPGWDARIAPSEDSEPVVDDTGHFVVAPVPVAIAPVPLLLRPPPPPPAGGARSAPSTPSEFPRPSSAPRPTAPQARAPPVIAPSRPADVKAAAPATRLSALSEAASLARASHAASAPQPQPPHGAAGPFTRRSSDSLTLFAGNSTPMLHATHAGNSTPMLLAGNSTPMLAAAHRAGGTAASTPFHAYTSLRTEWQPTRNAWDDTDLHADPFM